jgi:hypothetical protein
MLEPLTPDEVAVLLKLIEDQKAEIARLRSNQSLLDVLREIAIDPAVPPHLRLKAAEAGVQYEVPRLSASISQSFGFRGIGERMHEARKRREAEHLRLVEPAEAG